MADWLVRQSGTPPIGPVSTELLIRGIEAGKVARDAEVCRVGTADWLPLEMVDEFSDVAYDEDAATRVTESPWFADQASQPRIAPPAPPRTLLGLAPPAAPGRRPAPPPPTSSPRAGPPPIASSPRASSPRAAQPAPGPRPAPPVPSGARPAPPVSSGPRPIARDPRSKPQPAPPPPQALPVPPRAPAASPYDVDDNAMTRVATSPRDAPMGGSAYEFDDETMTRVAAPRAPEAPLGASPPKPGLLKTAPMWDAQLPKIEPVRPAAGQPAQPRPSPRPAAGTRPDSDAIQVRADLLPEPPQFPEPPPGFGPRPAAPGFPPPQQHQQQPMQPMQQPPPAGYQPPYFGPTLPAGMPPPPAYGAPPPGHYPPQQAPVERRSSGDGGVKALIGLIVVLFLALMVVLILLVLRR